MNHTRSKSRVDVVNEFVTNGDGRYLEIGVRSGTTFWHIPAKLRVGVDPNFVGRKLAAYHAMSRVLMRTGWRKGTLLFAEPSDTFFERHVERVLGARQFDCVLVDGLHTNEQAYRDVDNALPWLTPGGAIVMHDCSPSTKTRALPREDEARAMPDFDGYWNGDVWRAVLTLRTREDINVRVLDTDFGLGIVTHGKPDSILSLSEADIASMTYEEFSERRVELLNLVPA